MTRDDIRSFVERDWQAVEDEKARFWVEQKRHMTPAQALAAGEVLRRHALQVKPDWPDENERAEDFRVHVRVGEALRAVSGHWPR